jgi:hypothetical protein
MDHCPSRQTGMTFIGFLLMFVLIGFFTLLVLKLAPIYLEHYKVLSSLESLKSDPALGDKTKEEILTLLQNRWDINSVDRVSSKDVQVTKQGGHVKVQVAYEVSEHIMGNVDALVYFDDAIEAGAN